MKRVCLRAGFIFVIIGSYVSDNMDRFRMEPQIFKNNKVNYVHDEIDVDKLYILGVLNHEESLLFNDYCVSDFNLEPNICVSDLTSSYRDLILKNDDSYLNRDNFCRILFFNNFISMNQYIHTFEIIKSSEFFKDVESCFDVVFKWSAVTNDTFFTTSSTNISKQYYLPKVSAHLGWNIETGSSTVKIAVIDTGLYKNHEDFSGSNIYQTSISWSSNLSSFQPTIEHGTLVSGIISGTKNNRKGIAGINPISKLYSIRISDDNVSNGLETSAAFIWALNQATEKNIHLCNFSGGFYTEFYGSSVAQINENEMPALKQSIINFNGLLVVAAGNESQNIDDNASDGSYPTKWKLKNVISVGASDENDNICDFSNYGHDSVNVFAPGKKIVSTSFAFANNSYTSKYENQFSGTSFSCPQVTAAASLIMSHYPSLDQYAVRQTILTNVDICSNLQSLCTSNGRLNIKKSLLYPHSHTYFYLYLNSQKHKKLCTCGYEINEFHMWDFENMYVQGNQTYGKCFSCNQYFPMNF